jgi:hypothetical protein
MSLRLFVYYCMICGAWAGLVGWGFGLVLRMALLSSVDEEKYGWYIAKAILIAISLSLAVAFGLSLLDATFNLSWRQFGKVFMRVAAACVIGFFGGLIGSFISGSLYFWLPWSVFFVLGWTIVGFLIGASISCFEVVMSIMQKKDLSGSVKKFVKCVVGGTMGGILGGVIALVMKLVAISVFPSKDVERLWSPTAIGFVALGACIGLLVGLAQVILKEAWIKVEAGFRPGREMILTKEATSIGRAEGSDIALFGDSGVEKAHACIVKDNGRYYLEDRQTPGGSFVNNQKIEGRAPLKTGDLIRVGNSVLRFNERAKRR